MDKYINNNSIHLYIHVYTTSIIPHMLGTDITRNTVYFRKCKLYNLETDEIEDNKIILKTQYNKYINSKNTYKIFNATKILKLYNYRELKEKIKSKLLDKYEYENYQIDISISFLKKYYITENIHNSNCISKLITFCYDIGIYSPIEIKVIAEYNDNALKYLDVIDKLNL